MSHEVFLSYSSEDKQIAGAVLNILESHKIKCWIAYRDAEPGDEYAGSIIRAIKSSKIMVLILSSNANQSKHILNEVNSAVNYGITILPFKIEDVMLNDSMEYYLGKTHWLDALTIPLEQHINKLAAVIKSHLGGGAEHAKTQDSQTGQNFVPSPTFISQPQTQISTENLYTTKVATYEEMLGLGYTAEKIAIQLLENDFLCTNDFIKDFDASPEEYQKFILNSSEDCRYLLNGRNEIVGDWSVVGLNEQFYNKMMTGEFEDKEIKFDDTEFVGFADIYYGYILSMTILPDYKNTQNFMKMLDALFAQIETYAEDGAYFKSWGMNIFTPDVESMMKRLGFVFKCDNKIMGKMFELPFLPANPTNPMMKKFPRLKELYELKAKEIEG